MGHAYGKQDNLKYQSSTAVHLLFAMGSLTDLEPCQIGQAHWHGTSFQGSPLVSHITIPGVTGMHHYAQLFARMLGVGDAFSS